MRRLGLVLLCLTSLAASAAAKELNQIAIHYKYNDGDFPGVINDIEAFTKANKKYDRKDSVFIAKHLAVVYTANPDTRERGKYYMYQLLELVPSAELVDMYVSDEIDKIFAKVKDEYQTRHKEQLAAEAQAKEPERQPLWKNPWVWTGGAVAAGVAGYLTYEAVSANPKERPEYVVP